MINTPYGETLQAIQKAIVECDFLDFDPLELPRSIKKQQRDCVFKCGQLIKPTDATWSNNESDPNKRLIAHQKCAAFFFKSNTKELTALNEYREKYNKDAPPGWDHRSPDK